MRVWVSGSAGKLGAEVVRRLRAAGHEPVGADRAADGSERVDLEDPEAVAASLAGCDAIIHCAAIPGPVGIAPHELFRINTMSTVNALEQAWQAGIRVAALASSGSIFGTAWSPEPTVSPYVPVDEDAPLEYVDPYALSKDVLERAGAMYARRGMAVAALRLHWILTDDEVRAQAETELGPDDARNLWGYVELGDAARAFVAAVETGARAPAGWYRAFMIAADRTRRREPTSELLARWCPDTEVRAELVGTSGAFDISRAAAELGWRPGRIDL